MEKAKISLECEICDYSEFRIIQQIECDRFWTKTKCDQKKEHLLYIHVFKDTSRLHPLQGWAECEDSEILFAK